MEVILAKVNLKNSNHVTDLNALLNANGLAGVGGESAVPLVPKTVTRLCTHDPDNVNAPKETKMSKPKKAIALETLMRPKSVQMCQLVQLEIVNGLVGAHGVNVVLLAEMLLKKERGLVGALKKS